MRAHGILQERADPPRRVVVLSTIAWFTIRLARTAALAGLRPFVVTDRYCGRDRLSFHARRRLVLDRAELAAGTPAALAEINAFIDENAIDVVVAADTRCTRMLARRRDAIRNAAVFPLPSFEVFEQLNDKWAFHDVLLKHGLATPRTALAASPDAVDALGLAYPVVVKPRVGENADGVLRIDDRDALRRHLRAQRGSLPRLVQEWVPGFDIGVSVCADHGEVSSWLVQYRENGGMRFLDDGRALALAKAICRATAYHGVAHIDMRVDARTSEPKAIDFNPRFWGSMDYASWMGVNFLAAGLAILDRAPAPFSPAAGFCPFLGSTPGALVRWARAGFRPPVGEPAQQRAWRLQQLDPLPEWFEWTSAHLGLSRAARTRSVGSQRRA